MGMKIDASADGMGHGRSMTDESQCRCCVAATPSLDKLSRPSGDRDRAPLSCNQVRYSTVL
ncbi:hypothetical protein PspLS_02096 [Pyricularia sp. CBS 133598]|nr:hypothetical protein PspLS_02096 [Pyricularia sp. CBS 133598]